MRVIRTIVNADVALPGALQIVRWIAVIVAFFIAMIFFAWLDVGGNSHDFGNKGAWLISSAHAETPKIWWQPKQPHGYVGKPAYAKNCIDVGWRCGTYRKSTVIISCNNWQLCRLLP